MYDVIVIGAGPAGISASLYLKRANLKVLVLYSSISNLEKAEKIDNYYGFEKGISGKKLYEDGIKQAENLGVDVIKREVLAVENLGKEFVVKTDKEEYNVKAVIISTGNKKLKPNITGIEEFEGKGISYCAVCDAFFYRNKNVAVIGSGKFAISEAEELSHIAKNVTILTNGEKSLKTDFNVNEKNIKKIVGDTKVKAVEFKDGTSLEVDGIFIALGEAGASDFAKTIGIALNGESIKVNENMETNVKGIYACGNAVGGLLQVCKAVYEGAEAGLSAANYIRNLNGKDE